jgi:hypothetical protein
VSLLQAANAFHFESPYPFTFLIGEASMSLIEELTRVHFRGILDDKNISGLSFLNRLAVVVTDEPAKSQGNFVQIFEPDGNDYRPTQSGLVKLDDPPDQKDPPEMDLEGVAVDGDTVYILGSHSWRRRKVDGKNTYAQNRKALTSPAESQPGRDVLIKLRVNPAGEVKSVERTSLRPLLQHEPFKSFDAIASKENGIDIEGLAYFDGHLYAGFRGPVLRGNYVPVLKVRFDTLVQHHELLFVNLGGRGIRDLAHADNGLLVLAGPVGDGPGSYQLYHWDGLDTVPGADVHNPGKLLLLGDLPLPQAKKGGPTAAKAEGLALENESQHFWEILVVFDGVKDGQATRYRIKRPE